MRLYGALALALTALPATAAAQQPCNPVVDGTYCATQMPRSRTTPQTPRSDYRTMSSDLGIVSEKPATVGAVIFRAGGSRCVGGLFRGGCS